MLVKYTNNGQIGSSNILLAPRHDFKIQNSLPSHPSTLSLAAAPNLNANPAHSPTPHPSAVIPQPQRLLPLSAPVHLGRPSPRRRSSPSFSFNLNTPPIHSQRAPHTVSSKTRSLAATRVGAHPRKPHRLQGTPHYQILRFLFSAKYSSVGKSIFFLSDSVVGLVIPLKFLGFFSCREVDREVLVDMGQIQYSEKYFDDTYEYR